MKIDVLTLIEDALVGGRSGDMAYIYNNPFIFELFNQWKHKEDNLKLYQGNDAKAFKCFLNECLKEDKDDHKVETPQVVIGYKNLTKEYIVRHSDEDYTQWKKLETEINVKRNQQRDLLEAMAKKCNESLAEISIVKLQDTFQSKKIVFEFSVEAILEDKQQEDK